jgi:hypothetical protein
MARPKNIEKEEVAETQVSGPEAQLSKFLKSNKEDHYNFVEDVLYRVSSGSLALDAEIGGFTPGMSRLVGPSSAGKSSFAFGVVTQFFKTVENSRCVYIKAEGRLSDDIQKRTGLTFTKEADDWKNGTVFIFECNIYETIIGLMRELVVNNPAKIRYMFIIDSMDGLNLKNDIVKAIEEGNKVAGSPLLTKQMLQKISLGMGKNGHMCFFLGQVSAEIKLNPYEKGTPRQVGGSGGSAVQHFASHVLEFENWYESDLILENPSERLNAKTNRAIGHNCKIKISKSDKESRYIKLEIPIRHFENGGGGIWKEREIGDQLIMWRLVTKTDPEKNAKKGDDEGEKVEKKGGSWLYFDPALRSELKEKVDFEAPVKIQGLNQLYSLLESNKPVSDYLFEKFRSMISSN